MGQSGWTARSGWTAQAAALGTLTLALALGLGCGDDDGSSDAGGPDAGSLDAAFDGGSDAGPPVDAGPPPPPPSEPGRHDVELVDTRQIIPGDGLPAETPPMASNNNVDVVRHEGRVYLGWRTGPDHFANEEVVMHVISSEDEVSWRHEVSFDLDTDLREPRFLSWDGRLFFYFSVLGTNRYAFEPMGVRATELQEDGSWSEPVDIGMTGYVVWRTKEVGGTPYMTAYLGGEHIYMFDGEPLDVELRTTSNGIDWTPLTPSAEPEQTWVYRGGGSESDFAIGDDGTLYAVIRNEAGDETGWGSLVCSAPAGDLAAWSCTHDPKKYDSPRMFWHDGEAYLLARRNVTETGFYDLRHERGTDMWKTIQYQTDYSSQPKRCALWRWVRGEGRIAWVMDLPSRGDTCFPAILRGASEGEIIVYDYSNDLEGPDLAWNVGQRGETRIYRHTLRFTTR